ncbi:unnamed protein product, partial [Hapterophycus canaliculatus]
GWDSGVGKGRGLGAGKTRGLAPKAGGAEDWGEEEATCAICLCDEEEGQNLRVLPCGHFFHSDCVDVWLAQSSSCPFCKQDVELPSAAGGESKGGGAGILGASAAPVRSIRRWLRNHDRGSSSAVSGSGANAGAGASENSGIGLAEGMGGRSGGGGSGGGGTAGGGIGVAGAGTSA